MEVKVTNQESLIDWHCQRYSSSGKIERNVFDRLISEKFNNNEDKALRFVVEDFHRVMVERFGPKVKSIEQLLVMFNLNEETIPEVIEIKEDTKMSKPNKKVWDCLKSAGKPLLLTEILNAINLKEPYVRKILFRLVALDKIETEFATKYHPEAYNTTKVYSIKQGN